MAANVNAIEVQDLYKAFGELKAVQGVSFNVLQGEIFSLLGPNGAGKTTTISMLATLLRPDQGDALVMGHSVRKDPMGVKSVLGVVPQEIALYEDLTARENLTFWGKMYGLRGASLKQRVGEVLETIGLTDRAGERVGKYSGGMKRRVNIGVALLHKPQVIYMDEPTVGIDPQSRRNILDSVVLLKDQGMTVLYTTHYMEEAQELSDHIAIMDHGQMIASGTQEELVKIVGEKHRLHLTINVDSERMLDVWRGVQGVSQITVEDGSFTILAEDSNQVLPRLFDSALAQNVRITSVEIQEPNLETVFLHLTGRALRDELVPMKILDIAIKDLVRSLRSAMGLVFMFVLPLGITGLFYVMFGNIASSGGFELPRTTLVVANLDREAPRLQAGSGKTPGGFNARTLSELVVAVLRSEDLADLLEVRLVEGAAEAKTAVDSQQAQAAIIIPQGFSGQFADLNGTSQIEFYKDPTLTIGPGIVKSILNQFMDSLSAVKITVDLALDAAEDQNPALVGQVVQEYLDTSNTQTDDLSEALLEVRSPRQKPSTGAEKNPILNIVGPIMGAMMIFYAFYTGTATAESILREEEERTLPRLFTTPTPQATILGGKFLSVFLTVVVQMVVLIAAGRLIFGIRWGALEAVAMMVFGVVLAASGFGVFINSFLKDTKQGGVVFGGVLTVSGMLGMIRVFGMSSTTARLGDTVSLIVPQGWAVRGLVMAMNGEPVSSVMVNMLVLMAWSAVFFVIGVWRFKRRYA